MITQGRFSGMKIRHNLHGSGTDLTEVTGDEEMTDLHTERLGWWGGLCALMETHHHQCGNSVLIKQHEEEEIAVDSFVCASSTKDQPFVNKPDREGCAILMSPRHEDP